MDLGKEVRNYLVAHPGSKAKTIAKEICVEKAVVNSFLYTNLHLYEIDDDYCWSVIGTHIPKKLVPSIPTDPVLKKLQSQEYADVFTIDDFEHIADWTTMASPAPGAHKFEFEIWCGPRAGKQIICDSKSEVKLLEYLKEHDLVLDIAGQALRIPYATSFSKSKDYYPDIIVLTNDYHIAIIEVKASTAMDQHMNIEKYEALDDYCYQHGYEYMMIDPDNSFLTFEDLKSMPVNPDLLDIFLIMEEEKVTIVKDPIAPYLTIDNDDVEQWYEEYGSGMTKKEFRLQVHSCIAYFDWYNFFDNGFRAYSRPVLLGKNHQVLSWI